LLIAYSLLAQSGQSIGDRLELALDFRPERGHGADDDNSDQAGDEAIFDGRDTGLIIDEAAKQMTHKLNSSSGATYRLQIVFSTGCFWNRSTINKHGLRGRYTTD
jgi:hypothetical protein